MPGNGPRSLLAGTRATLLGAVVCCLLWGSAFPCIKIGYRLFAIEGDDAASQILFAGCRFALAGVLVIVAGSVLQRRLLLPRRTALRSIAALGLTHTTVQYLLFYIGLAHASGISSSIISGANACVTILIACLIFRTERFTTRKLAGCLLGFGGVVLLNLTGGTEWAFAWNGEGFVLLSTVASSLASVMIKRYSETENTVLLSGWQFVFGGGVLAVCGLLFGGTLRPAGATAVALLLYLAFLSAAAYTLWGLLLHHNPVSGVSVYKCLIPVFGVLLSACWLGEGAAALRWQTPVSLALVVLGVLCVNWQKKRAE